MARARTIVSSDFGQVLVESYAVNERMNQLVLENLDPRAWRVTVRGNKGRTIAAIFSHMHNIRRKWLRLSASHLTLPSPLNRSNCSQKQASAALAESAERCCEMLADALTEQSKSIVKTFRRDAWARAWPAGAAMVAYMITHEAHHRGQVCMLAHQHGFPLPATAAYGLWTWEKLWKDCGLTEPR